MWCNYLSHLRYPFLVLNPQFPLVILSWMPQDLINGMSTLVQVAADLIWSHIPQTSLKSYWLLGCKIFPWQQGSWGQHVAHLGPIGPRWAHVAPWTLRSGLFMSLGPVILVVIRFWHQKLLMYSLDTTDSLWLRDSIWWHRSGSTLLTVWWHHAIIWTNIDWSVVDAWEAFPEKCSWP